MPLPNHLRLFHTDRIEVRTGARPRPVCGRRPWANPDCGLRTRRWDVVAAKLKSLVEGTRRARKELGLEA